MGFNIENGHFDIHFTHNDHHQHTLIIETNDSTTNWVIIERLQAAITNLGDDATVNWAVKTNTVSRFDNEAF